MQLLHCHCKAHQAAARIKSIEDDAVFVVRKQAWFLLALLALLGEIFFPCVPQTVRISAKSLLGIWEGGGESGGELLATAARGSACPGHLRT